MAGYIEYNESMLVKICNVCKDGLIDQLEKLLNSIGSPSLINHYLNGMLVTTAEFMTTRTFNSLMIASLNGHDNIVEFLLKKYHCEIEREGTIKFSCLYQEDFNYTALWLAASKNNFSCVRLLVELGKANIKFCTTNTKISLLYGICLDKNANLELIKYLLARLDNDSAQQLIVTPDRDGTTCLMIASENGHYDIVQYILNDEKTRLLTLNVQNRNGTTALHCAIAGGRLDIVKLLMENNADMQLKDKDGRTPLIAAGVTNNEEIINYFIEDEKWCTLLDAIQQFEIYAVSKIKNIDIESRVIYSSLMWSMKLRYKNLDKPILKTNLSIVPQIEAYECRRESQTIEELESIIDLDDINLLGLECLIIQERLFGITKEHVHSVYAYGMICAEKNNFQRCLQMFLHANRLEQKMENMDLDDRSIHLLFITRIMYNIIISDQIEQITFDIYSESFYGIINLFKHIQTNTHEKTSDLELEDLALMFVFVATKILPFKSKEEQQIIYELIKKLNHLNIRKPDTNQSLLHLALEKKVLREYTNDIENPYSFSCVETIRLLVSCGASVNVFDIKQNTPLHYLAQYQVTDTDEDETTFDNIRTILNDLIRAGAHLDYVNLEDKTPADCINSNKMIEYIFRQDESQLHLKCLCARMIKTTKLNYNPQQISKELNTFIQLH